MKADTKVGEVRDAIVVPEQAVVESQAGPTVYTVDKQGKVAVVPVRATFTHEGLRVLESGLKPGQAVIVEGLQLVRTGMTVKTRPADARRPWPRPAPAEDAGAGRRARPRRNPTGRGRRPPVIAPNPVPRLPDPSSRRPRKRHP